MGDPELLPARPKPSPTPDRRPWPPRQPLHHAHGRRRNRRKARWTLAKRLASQISQIPLVEAKSVLTRSGGRLPPGPAGTHAATSCGGDLCSRPTTTMPSARPCVRRWPPEVDDALPYWPQRWASIPDSGYPGLPYNASEFWEFFQPQVQEGERQFKQRCDSRFRVRLAVLRAEAMELAHTEDSH